MASQPIQDLSVRLSLDDKLSAELRAAAAVLAAQGRGMAQALQPAQDALVRFDKDGRASLERLAVGAQQSAAAVAKSVAGIERTVESADLGGNLGAGFEKSAQGVSLLDASSAKLLGTLTGLAGGLLSVGQAVQFVGDAFADARRFEDAFARIQLDLDLSAEAARGLSESIEKLAAQRSLPILDVLQAARKAIQEGAGSEAEVLQVLGASLDLVQARLATVPESISLLTARLGALQESEAAAGREAATLSVLLEKSGTSAQALESGLSRILPKARDIGASARDVDTLFLALRNGGRTAEASFAAIEGFLNEAFTDEGQAKFREFGLNFSRAEIAARGLVPLLQEAAERFGDNEKSLAALSSKGGGLSRILLTFADGTSSVANAVRDLDGALQTLEDRAAKGADGIDAIFKRFESRYEQFKLESGRAIAQVFASELARFEIAAEALGEVGVKIPGFETGAERKAEIEERTLQALSNQGDQAARLTLELRQAQAQAAELQASIAGIESAKDRSGSFLLPFTPAFEASAEALDKLKAQAALAQSRVESLGAAIAALKSPEAPIEVRFEPLFDFRDSALSEDVLKFQALASKALASVSLPPLEVGVTVGLPENVEKAAAGLRELLEKSTLTKAELEAAKEYFAVIGAGAAAQAQSEQLLAQLRARSLDGLERQTAESGILLAGIEKQIAALQAEGVAVDALRAAFQALAEAEKRRLSDAGSAQAKQLADQRAALGERVDSLGGNLSTDLDAQFRAIDERVRAATREIDKFRDARIRAGTATPEELAGLDALTAKAIGLGAALKGDARTDLGRQLADSIRDVEGAVLGLGKGLQTGLDGTFADIDERVQGVLDRIQKAREDGAKAGTLTPIDAAKLDDAAVKARLLGDALKFDAQTEQAREFLSVLADIGRQAQSGALAGLSDPAKQLGQLGIDLTAAQDEARRNVLEQQVRFGFDDEEVKRLTTQATDALRQEFEAEQNRLVLDFVLRPQVDIEAEKLRDELEKKLAPIAAQIQATIAAARADGIVDEGEAAAIAAGFDQARIAAEAFRKEIERGSDAFEKGFSSTLTDRVKAATDEFAQGAALAARGFDALGNSLGDAFLSIVDGSKSAKEAFQDFVKSFLTQLAQILTQQLAFSLIGGVVGGGTAAAGGIFAEGGIMAGEMQPPRAFAQGGIMPGSMRAMGDLSNAGKSLPTMHYALGGVARTPQMAVFAEKPGMAEAFVPLPGPDRGIPVEFKNAPTSGRAEQAEANVVQNSVAVTFTIQALDGASVREIIAREARTIENLVAAAVSNGSNRGLTESVRAAGNPSRG